MDILCNVCREENPLILKGNALLTIEKNTFREINPFNSKFVMLYGGFQLLDLIITSLKVT